jgi:hypothetical protein
VPLEEPGPHHQLGGDVAAPGPQGLLVDQDLAAAVQLQAGRPRLGDPGAVDLAGPERLQALGVVLRLDPDVAAALGGGGQALAGKPGPQGDVLGVAELRVDRVAPRRSAAEPIPGLTTRAAPPLVAPETIRIASPPDLVKALMAGLGPR